MPLIPEDGSGLTTANTFVTLVEFKAAAALRGWTVPADAEIEKRAVLAADYLDNEQRFKYRGLRLTATQRLAYPRTGVVERYGQPLTDGTIPWRLKQAQCELINFQQSRTLQSVLERGGDIRQLKVDVISISYGDKSSPEDVYPAVWGVLTPLLRDAEDDFQPSPYHIASTTPNEGDTYTE